jgi:hypothetical protein
MSTPNDRRNVMLTVLLLMAIAAFICVVAAAVPPGRVPLWVGVLLLAIIELLRALPLGR